MYGAAGQRIAVVRLRGGGGSEQREWGKFCEMRRIDVMQWIGIQRAVHAERARHTPITQAQVVHIGLHAAYLPSAAGLRAN